VRRWLVAILLASLATAARAESARWGSFEFSAGPYRPNVDAEFSGTTTPYAGAFGKSSGWVFRVGAARNVFTGFGTLEVGLSAGYMQANGHALKLDGTRSTDETTFSIIPTSAHLTYRLDVLADRYSVPLAPYVRASLERYNWWVNDAAGNRARKGATNGWSAALGLALLLDFFDSTLARELDNDSGVNHTYVFGEARKTKVDDFGSSKSWDLSDDGRFQYSFGLLLVF
jgi:hypothetical protein